jgi:hypothetical protein
MEKSKIFEIKNKQYEIKVIQENEGYRVGAFHNNDQISDYFVSSETVADMGITLNKNAIDSLIDQAQKDIEDGIGED